MWKAVEAARHQPVGTVGQGYVERPNEPACGKVLYSEKFIDEGYALPAHHRLQNQAAIRIDRTALYISNNARSFEPVTPWVAIFLVEQRKPEKVFWRGHRCSRRQQPGRESRREPYIGKVLAFSSRPTCRLDAVPDSKGCLVASKFDQTRLCVELNVDMRVIFLKIGKMEHQPA